MTQTLGRKLAVTVAGAGALSMIFGAGLSAAAPTQPHHQQPAPSHARTVPGTSCSVMQVEKALAKEDPALWKKISANPKRKQRFEQMIMLTPQQRKAKRAQWRKSHPLEVSAFKFAKDHNLTPHHYTPAQRAKRMKEMKALKAKIVSTCSEY